MKRTPACLLCLWVLGTASIASAQGRPTGQQGGPPGRADTVTVGLGIALTTSYDGASDYKIIPGGALRGTVKGHDFQLNGPQLFIDAVPNDPRRKIEVELGPVVGVRFNRTGKVSDARVAALGELEGAVEIGGRGAIGRRGLLDRTDRLAIALTAAWDVAGAHGSHILSPSLEYSRLVGRRTFVRVALTGEWVGGAYADYNYGINAAGAAASGLAIHDPKGGLASLGTNLLATHSLGGGRTGWSLFGVISYKHLQGSLAASPIVRDTGSPTQIFASTGLAYSF